MKNLSLIKRIFFAIILGILIGLGCSYINFDIPVRALMTFNGLFGNLLSFLIPLIIVGFIVPGIASLGSKSGKGLLVTTLIAYASTFLIGIITFFIGRSLLPKFIVSASLSTSSVNVEPYFAIDIPPMFSVMSALVFAFLLGIGISRIKNSYLLKVSEEFNHVVSLTIKNLLIPLVPVYILSIFAKLSYNGEIFTTLKSFGLVYVVLFSIQGAYLLVQYVLAGTIKKQNPFKLLKNMIPAYMTALGTQSSAATIPVTLNCTIENKVDEDVADFVIPLGATINLAGDTITLVLASMAVMYMKGQVPTLSLMLPFIVMLGVTMVAAPGVPGGGVMASLGLLESMLGFGNVEKSLMIALHAAQDSFGTATNVTGDGAIAIIVESILRRNKKSNLKIEEAKEEFLPEVSCN
ncbi:dicarboxylate/amino acid:cation symporter [Clostridium sp. LIBA-8841]|uniref:dicarboxylate/amino acid:cation symporter n=1 Tax=Clostridium sp. LIBA-8841 TaxID=2987530 RepID=UPI002AC6431B|nr:dicarboxylate/amino acid:cation symporter [Clostridium sp. LIBA-8841]MDZ5253268.1 dicarboxylate/amino acid:cation symporter [Clostridium sp. LIBA-8841]